MHALTLDPSSAEDCSSSNFQESSQRPALPPQAPSSSVVLPTLPTTTVPVPSTLSTAAANNTVPSPNQLRRQQFPGRTKAQRHRGAVVANSTVSVTPPDHQGDDTADAQCTVVTERPLPPAEENGNVATVVHEQQPAASDNGQLLSSGAVDEKTRRYNRISMIIIYGREVLCILALILTTYATIQNSPPKISKAPPPVPFFAKGSLVNDWPTGALGTTQTRVSVSELSLVLYYAPWCAESQFARHAYERVAQLYYREAHFAAINCWQPGGECRARYTKVQSWPVLMAYQPSGLAIQYHQAWTTAALSRFMQSLMLPLHRFGSPGDLMDHMTGKDAVLVIFLDVAKHSKLYQRYYQASLKWLEKDPFQQVSFGVVTGQSSKLFGVDTVPSIRLYLWNETIEYDGTDPWKPQDLIAWVHKQLHVVSMWIAPPGNLKSTTLAPYLRQGPVLLLFSPRPLYEDSSDAYMMLRQLSMQYYNCPGDAWILEMAREYISDQRTSNAARYVEKRDHCARILGRHPSQEDEDTPGSHRYGRNRCKDGFKSTVSVSFVNVLNSSKFVDGKPVGGKASARDYCDIAPAVGCGTHEECGTFGPDASRKPSLMWQTDGCSSRRHNEVDTSYEQAQSIVTSMVDSEHDYRGPKLLAKQSLRRQCELLQLAEAEKSNVFFSEPARQKDSVDYYSAIGGLSCKHNKTLTFISMDSGLYHAFGERLGVDVLKEPNRTVAFIVDHTDESAYVLRDPINLYSLSKFVHDYYNRSLERLLRSKSTIYEHTHAFKVEQYVEQEQAYVDRHRTVLDAAKAKSRAEEESKKRAEKRQLASTSDSERSPNPSRETEEIDRVRMPHVYHRVREIYSSNFQRTVLDSNRTVVVSFYSAQCAFCYIQAHHLLTVSRLLRHQPNLWFVRIDGELNDLPWQYTMDVFPSLIIFPNGRKAESRIFPETLKVNVPNIIGFVLSNLVPAERLHATFLLCSDVNNASRNDCLHMLKRELTDAIRLSLLEWRHHSTDACKRDRIVRRLQLLKQSYLGTLRCLSHSCDLTQLVNVRKRILNLWTGEHCRTRSSRSSNRTEGTL
ncbi:thioredoxin domain-containing protein 11 [Anopheles maculipalpis]|uniref:thioredoxin domain-containing protein 11 n=1 Tax=Anopheles maculipalpis TaxID=1496333 RepID=UPI0021596E2A|nr:thioredoxin domain-containing protein 11 [Anopheles maculipalpis]